MNRDKLLCMALSESPDGIRIGGMFPEICLFAFSVIGLLATLFLGIETMAGPGRIWPCTKEIQQDRRNDPDACVLLQRNRRSEGQDSG